MSPAYAENDPSTNIGLWTLMPIAPFFVPNKYPIEGVMIRAEEFGLGTHSNILLIMTQFQN